MTLIMLFRSGRIINAALSGSLISSSTVKKTISKSPFTGNITNLIGINSRDAVKIYNGIFIGNGTIIKTTKKIYISTITPVGTILKNTGKSFTGSLVSSGINNKIINKLLFGVLTEVGVIRKALNINLFGNLNSLGIVNKLKGEIFNGTITFVSILIVRLRKYIIDVKTTANVTLYLQATAEITNYLPARAEVKYE